jgi:2-amino-4-hydroxy-6-hydroxymethyldihydropteridine diphosphokinase
MAEVFLALGSNLGERAGCLARARAELAASGVAPVALSSVYETEPWGPIAQGKYLNQVLRAMTDLNPKDLLASLRAIENRLGRNRANEQRYGPRTIDLDILLYDGLKLNNAELEIPHPRMLERAFVLVPLMEIAPDLVVNGTAIRDALGRLDRSGIVRLAEAN